MKFLPRRENNRKAVTASRATESGSPSDDLWAPKVHDGQYNVNGRVVNGKSNYESNWGDSKGYGSAASDAWGKD